MRVVASLVVLVGIAAACGGAAETNLFNEVPNGVVGTSTGGASSGSAGSTSGAASSGSTSSSSGISCDPCETSSGTVPIDAGVDSGPPAPKLCKVDSNTCALNEYCHVETCDLVGVCIKRPDQTSPELTPVCGCDHVTYWNSTIAASRGANVAATGQCAVGASCTRNTGCAGDAVCDLEQALVCSAAEVKGTCWQLPKTCDGTNSRQVRRCSNQQCTSLCAAIADERQFVPGTGCP